jgi:hypothetical protein
METVINLETYLRIKLDEKDAKQIYDISTDDVRGWIDTYNELIEKEFPITKTNNL